jgi:hypothetical protein
LPPVESLLIPLLLAVAAGWVTAAAAERLGFLAGVVVPGLFIVAIAYLIWSGGLRGERPASRMRSEPAVLLAPCTTSR